MNALDTAFALLKRQQTLSEHGFTGLPPQPEPAEALGPQYSADEEMARVAQEFQESMVPPKAARDIPAKPADHHWTSRWPNIAPGHASGRDAYGPDPTGRWVAKIPTHHPAKRRSPIRDWAEAAWAQNLPVQPEKQFGGEGDTPFFLQRYVEPSEEEQAENAVEAEAQHAVDDAQQRHDALISEGGTGLVYGQRLEGEQEAQQRVAVLAARDVRDALQEELEEQRGYAEMEADERAEPVSSQVGRYGFADVHGKNVVAGQNIDSERFSAGLPGQRVAPMRAQAEGYDMTGLGRGGEGPPTFYRDLHARLLAQEEPPEGADAADWAHFRDNLMPHLQARATAESGQRFIVDWADPDEQEGLIPEGYTPELPPSGFREQALPGTAGRFDWENFESNWGDRYAGEPGRSWD